MESQGFKAGGRGICAEKVVGVAEDKEGDVNGLFDGILLFVQKNAYERLYNIENI